MGDMGKITLSITIFTLLKVHLVTPLPLKENCLVSLVFNVFWDECTKNV